MMLIQCRSILVLVTAMSWLVTAAYGSNIGLSLTAGATTTNSGVVLVLPSPTGTDVFTVSTANLTSSGQITLTADTGNEPLPVNITLCQTNSSSGSCLAPAASSLTATPASTVAVYVNVLRPIPLDTTFHRVYVRASDANGNSLGVTSVAIQNATYGPQLYIDKGGTYSGNWQNQGDNNGVLGDGGNAVMINTTAPVVLENCFIRSTQQLVNAVSGANVTIRNCNGYGLNPGIAEQNNVSFLFSQNIGGLTFEHNYMESVAVGLALWVSGPSVSSNQSTVSGPIVIRYNKVRNLNALASDGQGGFITNVNPNQNIGGFIIIRQTKMPYGAEVAWNEVIEDPYLSATSDVIDFWSSPGTSTASVNIHDNYFYGQYAPIPTQGNGAGSCSPLNAPTACATYAAQVITLDGSPADTLQTATSFIKISNNQLVNTWGGIILGSGHNNEVSGNRVISTGQLSDGTWMSPAANVDAGISDYDAYETGSSAYFNNNVHDNVVGRVSEQVNANNPTIYLPPPLRGISYQYGNSTRLTGCPNGDASQCINNIIMPDPITSATQANETTLWQQKLSNNSITVGPVLPTALADCLFNWAEKSYPQYFYPARAVSQTNVPPYYYRYYSSTGNYLAVSFADNNVWVLGPSFGNDLVDVGLETPFLSASGCQ